MFPDSRKLKARHFVEDSKGEPLVVHNVITVQVRVFVEVFGGSAGLCFINPGCHFCRGPVRCCCFAYRWLTHVDFHSLMHSESFARALHGFALFIPRHWGIERSEILWANMIK